MLLRVFYFAVIAWMMAGCQKNESPDPLNLRTITLPGGRQVFAEVMFRREDMRRGMMFRGSLAEDRALLFIHPKPNRYPYWMFNVRVPLDIIWLDREHHIVEISERTPPCLSEDPVKCPMYGGKADAQFVLELAAGMVAKHGIKQGQILPF